MSVTLENIEQIIDRTKVSYKEAKETLESCGGDVVEAIVRIEQKQAQTNEDAYKEKKEAFEAKRDNFTNQIKLLSKQLMKLLKKAMGIKIVWKKSDKLLLELPLLIVAIVAVWAMPISFIALVVPFFFGISMQLHRENGKVTNVNDWIKTHTGDNSDSNH